MHLEALHLRVVHATSLQRIAGVQPELCQKKMCSLASVPARTAALVRALEFGAPALAATATCPLRLADVLNCNTLCLLRPLTHPDLLFQALSVERGITLCDARCIYQHAGTALTIRMLANFARRIVWVDLLKLPESCTSQHSELYMHGLIMHSMLLLFTLLSFPFYVTDDADQDTAVREAAER